MPDYEPLLVPRRILDRFMAATEWVESERTKRKGRRHGPRGYDNRPAYFVEIVDVHTDSCAAGVDGQVFYSGYFYPAGPSRTTATDREDCTIKCALIANGEALAAGEIFMATPQYEFPYLDSYGDPIPAASSGDDQAVLVFYIQPEIWRLTST